MIYGRCDYCKAELLIGPPELDFAYIMVESILQDDYPTGRHFCDYYCAVNWMSQFNGKYTKMERPNPQKMPASLEAAFQFCDMPNPRTT